MCDVYNASFADIASFADNASFADIVCDQTNTRCSWVDSVHMCRTSDGLYGLQEELASHHEELLLPSTG